MSSANSPEFQHMTDFKCQGAKYVGTVLRSLAGEELYDGEYMVSNDCMYMLSRESSALKLYSITTLWNNDNDRTGSNIIDNEYNSIWSLHTQPTPQKLELTNSGCLLWKTANDLILSEYCYITENDEPDEIVQEYDGNDIFITTEFEYTDTVTHAADDKSFLNDFHDFITDVSNIKINQNIFDTTHNTINYNTNLNNFDANRYGFDNPIYLIPIGVVLFGVIISICCLMVNVLITKQKNKYDDDTDDNDNPDMFMDNKNKNNNNNFQVIHPVVKDHVSTPPNQRYISNDNVVNLSIVSMNANNNTPKHNQLYVPHYAIGRSISSDSSDMDGHKYLNDKSIQSPTIPNVLSDDEENEI